VQEDIDIHASCGEIYDTIVDVARWGRFSPECTGAAVRAPGPLALGDAFTGTNSRGPRRWRTRCVVTAADPGERFTIRTSALGLAIATWDYEVSALPEGRGARVTQTWQDQRGRVMRVIAVLVSGIQDRATHNRESMQTTLHRLKDHLEDPRRGR
jgi:hypothetical protein